MKLWTVKEIANLFSKTEDAIREAITDGDFPTAFKFRGGWYVKQEDIDRITHSKSDDDKIDKAHAVQRSSKGFVREW